MSPSIHDTASAYEVEFRAALMARGSTLREWAELAGFNRQHVSAALKGKSFGPKAREIRRRLLAEVGKA